MWGAGLHDLQGHPLTLDPHAEVGPCGTQVQYIHSYREVAFLEGMAQIGEYCNVEIGVPIQRDVQVAEALCITGRSGPERPSPHPWSVTCEDLPDQNKMLGT